VDDILGFGVSVGPTRPIRDAKKVPKEWAVYYDDLMNLRHSLKGALGQRSNETLGASARESSGELSINSADSGSESFNRDVALSMLLTSRKHWRRSRTPSTEFLMVLLAFVKKQRNRSRNLV